MSLINAHKGRKLVRDLSMSDASGTTVNAASGDVLRVKIGIRGSTPLLDLDSVAATSAGSVVTKNSPSTGLNRLEIEAADMNISPGTYTLEMLLYDGTDGTIKHVDHEVFVVQDTMTGDVGNT